MKQKVETYLDWADFDFKLDKDNRLSGPENWEVFKTAISVALQTVGYKDELRPYLTPVDEAKIAKAILGAIREAPMAAVAGLTKGTEMLGTLGHLYGSSGVDRQMDLWTQLQEESWDGKQSATEYVVDFRRLVRRCGEVSMPVNKGQETTMFLNSIKAKEGKDWVTKIKTTLRQTASFSIQQLYDDFVSEFRDKDKAGKKGATYAGGGGGKDRDRDMSRVKCWVCGKYGHYAKDCPERKARRKAPMSLDHLGDW
ncbi:hypothetical protein GGS26DRAFT_584004 [Hypomontagnella submonticulosa]|nr:hypothetical protein GGS26DRAFT_584004 [Hypomontagnella submonticulosa]